MINTLIKFLTGKEIVLYNKHRQTYPLINDRANRKHYFFVPVIYFWRIIPISGNYKIKYHLMYWMLNIISPKYIVDINWISTWHSLYYLWAKRHPNSRFVVVQHGLYVGGIITDVAHRYTKCSMMLCWSNYFVQLFSTLNAGKRVKLIAFGNPVYNQHSRSTWQYRSKNNGTVLIAPSAIGGSRLEELISFSNKLKSLGFAVMVKEHNFQKRMYGKITGDVEITEDLFLILQKQKFDLVVSDHSSALVDAIFFKNKVLWFGPEGELKAFAENRYDRYLVNVAATYNAFQTQADVYNALNIDGQENLLAELINNGDNSMAVLN